MLELKEKIVALCNESGLPIEAVFFILKDLYRDADETLKIYNKQKEEQASKAEKIKKEDAEIVKENE